MLLSERIKYLKDILNRYSTEEINNIYKQTELDLVLKSFNKASHVKYSANMQKRMVAEAKRKKISTKRLAFIQEMINTINNFDLHEEIDNFVNTSLEWIDKLSDQSDKIKLIHIEHSYDPSPQTLQAYSDYDYKDELACFNVHYDLASILEFTTKHKFCSMAEALEGLTIEGEEYPLIFEEIFQLLSYQQIEMALNSAEVSRAIKKAFPNENLKIEFGQHDNWFYSIYKAKPGS